MTKQTLATVIGVAGLLFIAPHSPAQTPRVTHVMPMGGQAGSTLELRVAGADLGEVEGLHFNFPGVKVESLGSEATVLPPKGKQKGGGMKLPAKLTTQRFKVTLPAGAPLGIQDVRIVTKAGVSNPRAFVVSDQKEFTEQEPNDDEPKAQKIELNSTVNGVIATPADVDYYAFIGKKGQRVVAACLTTSIDSRLPAFVQVFSTSGSELGSGRGYANNDALVDVSLPEDGEYFVRVCCFSYTQGGIDHFYRLTVTTAPWIDAVFPSVVEPGKETKVTVVGRNLPGGKLDPTLMVNDRALETVVTTVKASADPRAMQRLAHAGYVPPPASSLDGFDFRLRNGAGSSNTVLLTYAAGPIVLDTGENDVQAKGQKVSAPCAIAGRIEKKGDRDWYVFTAKKGQVLHIDLFGDRIASPVDLYFQLRSSAGTLIVEQDDNAEILSPQFYTRNDDPAGYRFVAPADGTYHLMVSSRDAFTQFGPRHTYVLRLAAEEPDFRLVAMPIATQFPDGSLVHQSGGVAFNLYVWRFGGFNETIHLSGENLPPGLVVPPQTISGNQKQAVAVVFADATAKNWTGGITILGTATVKGRKLTREVRSATMTWAVPQANIPSLTRLDRELVVAVRDQAPYTLAVSKQEISVKQGEKISIPVKLVPGPKFKGTVSVTAIGGPAGLASIPITLSAGQLGGTATLDAKGKAGATLTPGNYTIFLRGQTAPINPKQPPKIAPPNIVQISMPVMVTVVPKQLAKISAGPTNVKVGVGKGVEVTVKANRLYDLPISFKVELIIPANLQGVSAKTATIQNDADDTKITIVASPQAKVGANQSVIVRATAMFNGTIPIVHETKLTLVITK